EPQLMTGRSAKHQRIRGLNIGNQRSGAEHVVGRRRAVGRHEGSAARGGDELSEVVAALVVARAERADAEREQILVGGYRGGLLFAVRRLRQAAGIADERQRRTSRFQLTALVGGAF